MSAAARTGQQIDNRTQYRDADGNIHDRPSFWNAIKTLMGSFVASLSAAQQELQEILMTVGQLIPILYVAKASEDSTNVRKLPQVNIFTPRNGLDHSRTCINLNR